MTRRARLLAVWLAAAAGCGDDGEGTSRQSASQGLPPVVDLSAAIFDEDRLATFELRLDPLQWADLVEHPHDATWRRADLVWEGESVRDVGIRASGVTTRIPGHPKPSLRLDFDAFVPDRRWRGLAQLRLDAFVRDESFLRDRLSYWTYRAIGIAAPRAAHARLVVNDDYKGVYGVEEVIKKAFVKRWWPLDDDGNLYELLHLQSSAPDPYLWIDAQPSSYVPFPFEPDTNEAGDHSDVLHLLDTLNLGPIERRREAMDVEVFLGYLAALQALADYDGITASWGSNNHSWYRPSRSSLFRIVPWDPEFSLGLFGMSPSRDLWAGMERSKATSWIAQDADAASRFKARVLEVVDGPFAELPARIDACHAQIRDAVLADPYKHKSAAQFEASPAALKTWIQQRVAYLRTRI